MTLREWRGVLRGLKPLKGLLRFVNGAGQKIMKEGIVRRENLRVCQGKESHMCRIIHD